MARVQGPLHSDQANGTFAGSLTFARWKGRDYVRQRVDPANPKSALQTGVRSMMSWLSKRWASVSAPNKATWDAIAESLQISAFNAFIRGNMDRWDDSDAPSDATPAAEAGTAVTITTFTTTGDAGYVDVSITPSGGADHVGFIVYRDTAEITAPSRATVVKVIDSDGANAVNFVDSDLAAGTYHYRCAAFNNDGSLGTVKADQTAVVT